jgi:hypothetical protein
MNSKITKPTIVKFGDMSSEFNQNSKIEEIIKRFEKEFAIDLAPSIKLEAVDEQRKILYPNELEPVLDFLKSSLIEYGKEEFERGKKENAMALNIKVIEEFNSALKDETSPLIKLIQEAERKSLLEKIEKMKIPFKVSENMELREAYNGAIEDVKNLLV